VRGIRTGLKANQYQTQLAAAVALSKFKMPQPSAGKNAIEAHLGVLDCGSPLPLLKTGLPAKAPADWRSPKPRGILPAGFQKLAAAIPEPPLAAWPAPGLPRNDSSADAAEDAGLFFFISEICVIGGQMTWTLR
jgi:hypothetical protein